MLLTSLPVEFKPFPAQWVIETLINKFPLESGAQLYLKIGESVHEIDDYGQGIDGTSLWLDGQIDPRTQQDAETIYVDITSISTKCFDYLNKRLS